MKSSLDYRYFARSSLILPFLLLVTLVVSIFSTSAFSTRSLSYIAILGLAASFAFHGLQYSSKASDERGTADNNIDRP